MLTPWLRPAGVEFTRITPFSLIKNMPKFLLAKGLRERSNRDSPLYDHHRHEYYIHRDWAVFEKERIFKRLRKKFRPYKRLITEVEKDAHCFEVPSAKLYDWASLKRFFTVCDRIMASEGLLRFSPGVCGTGGHIHVSSTPEDALYILRMSLNHPWAMMAFCDPRDDQHSALNRKRANPLIAGDLYTDTATHLGYFSGGKVGPVAWRNEKHTVEFRMLDVAQTWEQQEEHMAFAQAFVAYAVAHPLKAKEVKYLDEVYGLDADTCCKGFKNLILTLELPWHRYSSYLYNIRTRFAWGTKNFSGYL